MRAVSVDGCERGVYRCKQDWKSPSGSNGSLAGHLARVRRPPRFRDPATRPLSSRPGSAGSIPAVKRTSAAIAGRQAGRPPRCHHTDFGRTGQCVARLYDTCHAKLSLSTRIGAAAWPRVDCPAPYVCPVQSQPRFSRGEPMPRRLNYCRGGGFILRSHPSSRRRARSAPRLCPRASEPRIKRYVAGRPTALSVRRVTVSRTVVTSVALRRGNDRPRRG